MLSPLFYIYKNTFQTMLKPALFFFQPVFCISWKGNLEGGPDTRHMRWNAMEKWIKLNWASSMKGWKGFNLWWGLVFWKDITHIRVFCNKTCSIKSDMTCLVTQQHRVSLKGPGESLFHQKTQGLTCPLALTFSLATHSQGEARLLSWVTSSGAHSKGGPITHLTFLGITHSKK